MAAASRVKVAAPASGPARTESRKASRPKLRIGPAQDAFEQEADRLAQAVVERGKTGLVRAGPLSGDVALQRKCSCGGAGKCKDCEDEKLQRKAAGSAAPAYAPPVVHDVLNAPGRPLDRGSRSFMESAFGRDFGAVRVHTDARAGASAREVGGLAYTVGQHIVFGAGTYAPETASGRRLLAHELTHTLQQRDGTLRLQRACYEEGECDGGSASVATLPASGLGAPDFLEAGWSDVNDGGVIYKEGTEAEKGGAYLRAAPEPGALPATWLPQNAKVYILKHHPVKQWYAVVAMSDSGGQMGYIAEWLVARNPPDADAGIVKIKPGDTPLEIAGRYYSGQGFDVWSKDKRYVVNALLYVNERAKHNFKGEPVIQKKGVKTAWLTVEGGSGAPWWTTQVRAGGYLWLPGAEYLNAIYEEVAKTEGTGSITGDLWRKVKKLYQKVAYGLAFAGGILHGFTKSIYDALVGLAELIGGVLKSIFTLNVISDVKELAAAIGKMTWEDIKEALGTWADKWATKLNSDSPWVAGHAHGYLTGYVMAEAAMLLMSGGTLAAAKQAVWGSKLGKALQETRAFQAFVKGVEKAGELGGKAKTAVKGAVEAAEKSRLGGVVKTARVAAKVVVWTAEGIGIALSLPGEIVKYLSTKVIAQLRRLEPWFGRIERLSKRAKRWLFGCKSPCVIDVDLILERMAFSEERIEREAAGVVRNRYARELADNPRLEEQLTHAEDMHGFDPSRAKAEADDVLEELKRIRGESGSTRPKKVEPYFRDLEALTKEAPGAAPARKKLGKAVQARMPEGTKVSVEKTPLTDAGVAQNRAASRGNRLSDPDIEYKIDLTDVQRRKAGLPERDPNRPAKGTFKPDDIKFYGQKGEKYLFLDHKEVEGLWGKSYYGSREGRTKIAEMLDRHARIAEAMGPKCLGWGYTTNNAELAKVIAEEIDKLGSVAKGRLFAPGVTP